MTSLDGDGLQVDGQAGVVAEVGLNLYGEEVEHLALRAVLALEHLNRDVLRGMWLLLLHENLLVTVNVINKHLVCIIPVIKLKF